MPKISYNNPLLQVAIPDIEFGKTIIMRKAELNYLIYQPRDKKVIMGIKVVPYSKNEEDLIGERLDDAKSPFKSTDMELIALPIYLVDAATGLYLCDTKDEYSTDEKGEQILNPVLLGVEYSDEFDFYDNVANKVPVIINELIAKRIQLLFAEQLTERTSE